jgi:hypothetical protein
MTPGVAAPRTPLSMPLGLGRVRMWRKRTIVPQPAGAPTVRQRSKPGWVERDTVVRRFSLSRAHSLFRTQALTVGEAFSRHD